ncbi:hypothetical protein KIL84_006183 [Mauremys mutica]|uniref:Uncharacterized protein n=1 Tax=Mauremys mutica TaxID=74926 RepID=A0A9D4AVY2_9SAUR|nr:hypothetical protein KIL84_006183 [Mauremys mutica]
MSRGSRCRLQLGSKGRSSGRVTRTQWRFVRSCTEEAPDSTGQFILVPQKPGTMLHVFECHLLAIYLFTMYRYTATELSCNKAQRHLLLTDVLYRDLHPRGSLGKGRE